MAKNVYDIGVGTKVDQSGIDEGLPKVEKKLKNPLKNNHLL